MTPSLNPGYMVKLLEQKMCYNSRNKYHIDKKFGLLNQRNEKLWQRLIRQRNHDTKVYDAKFNFQRLS